VDNNIRVGRKNYKKMVGFVGDDKIFDNKSDIQDWEGEKNKTK
jgi:hypothetical protein